MPDKTEGYVKYQAVYAKTENQIQAGLDEIDQARTQLWDWGLLGRYPNGVGFGNVSIRHGGGFWISGTATGGARELGYSGYCLVKEIDIDQNLVVCEGPVAASSEAMSHGAVYRANQAVNCVLHIHDKAMWDGMLREKLPGTSAAIAYGTPAMAWAIYNLEKELGSDSAALAMAGHEEGILVYGPSIPFAMERILELLRFKMEVKK